jgi:hypothetical protein
MTTLPSSTEASAQRQQRPLALGRPGFSGPTQLPRGVGSGSSPPPPPGLGSGASPPTRPASPPKFGKLLPDNAISQFITDLSGVWGAGALPALLLRNKIQFFETTFLEFVEDAAFYFTLPLVGPLAATLLNHAFKPKEVEKRGYKAVGTSLKEYGAEFAKQNPGKAGEPLMKTGAENVSRKLIASKSGAVIAAMGIAAGFEYMIQHVKNVMSAKVFHTKNFTAVAGLEQSQAQVQPGLQDPVEKAKRRGKHVGLGVVGALALAALAPVAVLKSGKAYGFAKKALQYLDFGSNSAKGSLFDLQKPLLAILTGIGAVSYMDAARDPLERKETALRLSVVIPYMLFGKELVGYGLAKYHEHFGKVGTGEDARRIKDLGIRFTNGKSPWQQLFKKDTFLNMGVVEKELTPQFEALAQQGKALPEAIKKALSKKHGRIGLWSYILSAAVCGIGINVLAYKKTEGRYKAQQEQQQVAGLPPGAAAHVPPGTPFESKPGNPFNNPAYRPDFGGRTTLQTPPSFRPFQQFPPQSRTQAAPPATY